MASTPTNESTVIYALLGMTTVTGLVDVVSYLSLGHVFTANMTGKIVLLAFATAHVSGLSVARSLTALLAFLTGATLGGRLMARTNADSQIRFEAQSFALIALTALAMGTRNAAVRKLGIPDLTTTVLTLTITGIGADSSVANGNNP